MKQSILHDKSMDWIVNFCAKHKISFSAFLNVWLLKHDGSRKLSAYRDAINPLYYKYMKEVGIFWGSDLSSLVDKGWVSVSQSVLDKHNGDYNSVPLQNYDVTEKFEKVFWIDAEIAGEELWEAYPSFLDIKGRKAPAKGCSKDELIALYMRAISNSKAKHEHVMEMLEKGLKEGLVNMNIAKFVGSRHWEIINQESESTPNYLQEG